MTRVYQRIGLPPTAVVYDVRAQESTFDFGARVIQE